MAGAELSIGEAKVTLASDKITPDKAATIELKTIDINKKDKAKELVIVDAGAEGAGTWWIVSYDGAAKTASEPVEVTVAGEPEIKGNGRSRQGRETAGDHHHDYTLKKACWPRARRRRRASTTRRSARADLSLSHDVPFRRARDMTGRAGRAGPDGRHGPASL